MEKCDVRVIGKNGSSTQRCIYCGHTFTKNERVPTKATDPECMEKAFYKSRALAQSADP